MSGEQPARRVSVLLPGIDNIPAKGGGFFNTLRFVDLLSRHRETELATYRHREPGTPFLEDIASEMERERRIAVLVWGPDIAELLDRYHGRFPMVYYQRSNDWGIDLPPDVPVLCISKYTMATAQQYWPGNPQFYLPPALRPECCSDGRDRDIDVLVVERKQPRYVVEDLCRRLGPHCRVHLQSDFISQDELIDLYRRSKVYLYSFAAMRTDHHHSGWRMMEGISNQTLEAIACGCTVFSDLRGGQLDFVQPGQWGFKLQTHSPEWDVEQILRAVADYPQIGQEAHRTFVEQEYSEEAFHQRAPQLLSFLDSFFDFAANHPPRVEAFDFPEPITSGRRLREHLYRWRRRLLG